MTLGKALDFKRKDNMVLYTDTIRGKQSFRDDLWAVSTDEIEQAKQAIGRAIERAKAITEEQNSSGRYPLKVDAIQGFRDNLWKELGIDSLPKGGE